MSLSPHTSFCATNTTRSLRSSFSSSKPRRSESSFYMAFPLPVPVRPEFLSMPAPSLGSNDILPRPKRGAPPIDPPSTRVAKPVLHPAGKRFRRMKTTPPANVHPAVCAEWF
ncbi:hypothetical protein FB451DRAFT_1385904 [Mycena latifolia]|nr:hypothetical protein FB451DRAFT_1385904 [Mycena latifolia]